MLDRSLANLYDDKDIMIGFDDIFGETADTLEHSPCRYYLVEIPFKNTSGKSVMYFALMC